MVVDKNILERIKKIIDKHYSKLTLSVLGKEVFSDEELEEFKRAGLNVDEPQSFLTMSYYHNFINQHNSRIAPTSISDMKNQQSNKAIIPLGQAHDYAIEHLNENAKEVLDKMKQDVMTKVSGIIRDSNQDYKNNALQNLARLAADDEIVKEQSISKIKQKLRDLSGDLNRDWDRIVITENSNAIGLGSTDRLISENQNKDAKEIYVYRIVVQDAALCKYCREFYLDSDGTPKVYKLSDLLNNGSNYGKKTGDWKPVITATHPFERCSQVIEVKPGWKVVSGGNLEYIGMEKWPEYIRNKVQ